MAIPKEIISAVRERTNITDVVGETVQLKRSGKYWVGLSPFKPEKTPSFFVNEEKGTYKCYSSGKYGSVFDFLMETKGFTFPEALQLLANRIGIKIPEKSVWKNKEDSEEAKKQEEHLRRLRELNRFVEQAYSEQLFDTEIGKSAQAYLRSRNISGETAKTFGLGFAPAGWQFLVSKITELVSSEEANSSLPKDEEQLALMLIELGLLKRKKASPAEQLEKGGELEVGKATFDGFRNRLIFSIARSDGSPIAFGARDMSGAKDTPKYLNSPENALYAKRKTLYGLPQAMETMRQERHAFLVEGYFDVISMWQSGFKNTIATCGTAVAEDHVSVLKRLVDRVTIVFDGDSAGRKAAGRCFDVFLNSGIEVSAVLLEDGEDPDSLAQSKSREEVSELLSAKKRPVVEIFLDERLAELGEAPYSSVVRGKVADEFTRVLLRVTNPVEREGLIERGADVIGVTKDALLDLLKLREAKQGKTVQRQATFVRKPLAEGRAPHAAPIQESSESVAASSRQVPRSEGRKPQQPQRVIQKLSSAEKCILIVCLVDPRVGESLLGGEIDRSDILLSQLSDPARAFLEEFCRSFSQGVGSESGEGPDPSELANMLQKYRLNAGSLVKDALCYRQDGGIEPERLLASLEEALPKFALRSEVERLRRAESKPSDAEELRKLAQEKLLRRRELEKLKGGD